ASLMCLSCHDGSIGVNRVINESNITGPIKFVNDPAEVFIGPDIFGVNPDKRIGGVVGDPWGTGNLNDDHPISFSYSAAQGADLDLHPIGDAQLAGLVFYPRNGTADHVECGTCHDPHVAYDNSGALGALTNASANPNYAPFLRISNTGSTMCLTCHNK
ncbi:MAG: cytochrome c3 family protein, partial [Desulfuromonadales bacterium]|nr:cytochrome c3 family protein [Desulfuromonadales bacterium]